MQSPSDIRAMRLAKLEALRKKQMEERKVELENDDATSKDVQQHQTIVNKTEGALPKGTYSTDHKCLQGGEQKSENVGISLERWKANELGRIFSVTLTPTDTSTSSLIYLESLRSELESDDLIGVDSPDTILTTLIFELGVRPHFASPLQYLFKSWSTAYDSKRLLNKLKTASYSEKVEFYDEILRLCSGYASILFYEPDTFIDQPTLIDITNELVLNYNRYQDFWVALLNSIVDNQTQLEFLNEILPILTDEIDRSLDTESLSTSSKYDTILAIIEALTMNKNICAYIHQMDIFNPKCLSSKQIELCSFLGKILRISPLLPKIADSNYVGVLNKSEIKTINKSLESSYSFLLDRLFNIINSLIRVNPDSRKQVLTFMADLVNKSHLRVSEHADDKDLASDSLMLNVTMILVKLSEPILRDGMASKTDKIAVDYLSYKTRLIDIAEETRINSTIQESNDLFSGDQLYDESKELNFISQCFYLMLTYLHYGLGGVISSYNKKTKINKQLKGQLKHLQEMLAKSNMDSNPFAQRLVRARIDPIEKKIDENENSIRSIDMFFCCREFQLEVFDTIIGVCEFLVRLIDEKHEYHPKMGNFFPYLKIPLHNFDDEISKLDDVEFLRKLSPVPFKYFPEIYVEGFVNYTHFISRFTNNPMVDNKAKLTKFVEFSIIVLRCPELISNPHLKSRLIEVLFFGSLPFQTNMGEQDGFMFPVFNEDETVRSNLLISLLDFYVMVEKTGASSQFYDKFNARYHISFIIEKLWKFDFFKQDLRTIATKFQKFFIRFVARMLNDTTYLLDESLNHLINIHNYQKELHRRAKGFQPETPDTDEELTKKLQDSERMAKSYVQLSNKTITLFNLFTKETPKSFTIVEIVDRLAGMLNYNLVVLVGPRYNELKVEEPEKYQFDPKELLLQLCSIFLNLSIEREFVEAVARDLRSFEPDNFIKAINILKKNYKIPNEYFEKHLLKFVEDAKNIKTADEEEELELGEVPDEFLDPLMFTLMKDPVRLPSSKISMDRSVLKAHLMNDPTDPFNRMPLKMEDVTDDIELKTKIAQWIQEKKSLPKDTDGDVTME
ncbi:E4 ubiquitin-protein ligase UFD2 [Pichia kudriavzevii]|uniref:RING-type E3 ubiquitin transferase n=2 Tax=Pichia kudriavzevii TaxID=4909 RepID=A0A1V2LPF2_PICKU|nr:E4 ubiquitin-protein ligase UFD2 [Pichia kudriavzevii]